MPGEREQKFRERLRGLTNSCCYPTDDRTKLTDFAHRLNYPTWKLPARKKPNRARSRSLTPRGKLAGVIGGLRGIGRRISWGSLDQELRAQKHTSLVASRD